MNERSYFGQTHTISLAHGFEITAELAKRKPLAWKKPLLAFGGAVYNPGTYQADMAKQLSTLGKYQYLLEQRSTALDPQHTPYAQYAGTVQTNLPGTKAEVLALSKLIEDAEIKLGTEVYEPDIHALAKNGQLTLYRCLHFAVHGSANPYKPELSALLLSMHKPLRKNTAPAADGFLSVEEIQRLNLRCEMVILSACETGQGAIYAGQGVVGLTQAFLSAGADQLIASLWPVGDASTAQFMVRVYELRLKKDMNWPDAVATTQREFMSGAFGKAQQQPIAWAPFNIYGAPDAFSFP
jgi:CHAT domain-containing protein